MKRDWEWGMLWLCIIVVEVAIAVLLYDLIVRS